MTRVSQCKVLTLLAGTLSSVLVLYQLASAKRLPPTKVNPVIYEGIRYVAPNNDARRGYIEAWNVGTNKKLWEFTLFTNRIDPNLEDDVQSVFIKSLKIQDGRLIATSERGEAYQFDLKTKEITQPNSRSPVSAEVSSQLPGAIKNALTKGPIGTKYEFSSRMKPSRLDGDFNGDGKMDTAVLVKERSTGKVGIAIIHGATGKVTVVGAGVSIGNGGDDFEWMDRWQVYSKTRAAHTIAETNPPHLRGDALLVEKSEAGSALIYWNGKRYLWSQHGD